MALATASEGRSKVWNDLQSNTLAARARADNAFRGAGAGVKRMPENLAASIGLSRADRDRMRMQNPDAKRRAFAMISAGTARAAGQIGKGAKLTGQGIAKGATKVGGSTHRAVMRAAGPGATAGQAYRKAGLRAAAIAGSLAVPGVAGVLAPIAFAAVGARTAKGNWKSKRAERKQAQQDRIGQIMGERQSVRHEAEAEQTSIDRAIEKVNQEEQTAAERERRAQAAAASKGQRDVEEAVRHQARQDQEDGGGRR